MYTRILHHYRDKINTKPHSFGVAKRKKVCYN